MIPLLTNILHSALDSSTPLLLAAMGGIIAQQAGMLNIGLEGKMLAGAFGAVIVSYLTGNVALALLGAVVAALLLGLIFSVFAIYLSANLVVVGLAINILAVGLAGYILPVALGVQGAFAPPGLAGLHDYALPLLDVIPVLGPALNGHTVLVYFSWFSVWLTAFLLYRTVWGMRARASGEEAEAARAAGVAVTATQLQAVLLCSALAGLAGAQLSLGELTLFNKGMTGGRGFIALAAFFFGAYRPGTTALACLLFGLFEALQFRLLRLAIPPQLIQTIPYLSVVIALSIVQIRRTLKRPARAAAATTTEVNQR